MSPKTYRREFSKKKIRLGVILPQNLKIEGVKQAPHSDQLTTRGTREMLFTPCCSTTVTEFPKFDQFFCTTYGFGATGRQNSPIFACLLIFPYKRLNRTW